LEASHLTRIDDLEMKPWHLKVNFQLFNRNGKPSEQGTYEYWWGGPMLLKARTESPSYTATVINNRDGNFRTAGSGPFPKQIAAIAEYLTYPMPMAEDLSGSIPHIGYEKLENLSLDCIELREPRSVVQPPTFCLEPATNVLRESVGPDRRPLFVTRLETSKGAQLASYSLQKRVNRSPPQRK
jgi:hypothetical protein